jgi:hypothetical protein
VAEPLLNGNQRVEMLDLPVARLHNRDIRARTVGLLDSDVERNARLYLRIEEIQAGALIFA